MSSSSKWVLWRDMVSVPARVVTKPRVAARRLWLGSGVRRGLPSSRSGGQGVLYKAGELLSDVMDVKPTRPKRGSRQAYELLRVQCRLACHTAKRVPSSRICTSTACLFVSGKQAPMCVRVCPGVDQRGETHQIDRSRTRAGGAER
jgi:hypothetical protein